MTVYYRYSIFGTTVENGQSGLLVTLHFGGGGGGHSAQKVLALETVVVQALWVGQRFQRFGKTVETTGGVAKIGDAAQLQVGTMGDASFLLGPFVHKRRGKVASRMITHASLEIDHPRHLVGSTKQLSHSRRIIKTRIFRAKRGSAHVTVFLGCVVA